MRSQNPHAPGVLHKTVVLALLISIGIFYAATIRQGNSWGDDFALYIHHAENLVLGKPYAETGYIYNPAVPEYGPRAYPPLFPLFLAPVYRVLGLNLVAMKFEEVVFFLLSLLVVFLYWQADLPFLSSLALIAILGCNPNFWAAKDNILSDLPFLFFFYLAAWLVRRGHSDQPHCWKWAITAGVVLYCAIGTRTIGLALVPGLLAYDFLRYRKVTSFTALAILVGALFVALQTYAIGLGEASYSDQLHPTLESFALNFASCARSLATFWSGSLRTPSALSTLVAVAIFAILGARRTLRTLGPLECFLAFYLLAVLVWPVSQGLRFLFPLLPFFVYVVLAGISALAAKLPRPLAVSTFAAVFGLIAASYLQSYRQTNFTVIAETDGLPSFNDLCRHILSNTNAGDVFVYARPRALTLFTSRPASVYKNGADAELESFIARIHAHYLVYSPLFPKDREFLSPFLQRHAGDFELIYQNSGFHLYRVHSQTRSATGMQPSVRLSPRCPANLRFSTAATARGAVTMNQSQLPANYQ